MKEALKLALEALTYFYTETTAYEDDVIDEAITAIKEALAQPDYRAVKTYHEGKPVYVSQPEQEPVATLWQHGETGRTRITMPDDITDCDARWFKAADLYTAPPKRPWVGLTEAENAICLGFNKVLGLQYQEAKLKEKNT